MSQQINLLNPELLTSHEWLDARTMAWLACALAIVLGMSYGWTSYRAVLLAREQQAVSAELVAVKLQLDQVIQQHTPKTHSKLLQEQLAIAETALKSRQQVLDFLKGGGLGSSQGFSGYMEAFARQSMKGLWLTGFAIDDSVSQIHISGRALRPDLVPQYIAGLGRESALKGREFSGLEMGAITSDSVATVAGKNPSAAAPEIVQFRLQSLDKKSVGEVNSPKSPEKKS